MAQLADTSLFADAQLKGYWKFEGDSADSSSLGQSHSDAGGISYGLAYGKYGQGASLNGTDGYVNLGTSNFNYASSFSIVSWIKMDAATGGGVIFNKGKGSTSGYRFYVRENQVDFTKYGVVQINKVVTLSEAEWHHVALVVDSSVRPTFYIDGVSAASDTNTQAINSSALASYIGVGINNAGATEEPFKGYLDDLATFNKALSAAEVYSLWLDGVDSQSPMFFSGGGLSVG